MVYKTSQVNKQDIRNKVAAKSRTVKQAPTAAKTHLGRHRLHRNLKVPRHTLPRHRLCQDVTLLRWLQQHLLDYLQPPRPLRSVTATVCPVRLPSVWPCILKGHGWNLLCGNNLPFSSHHSPCDYSLFLVSQSHLFPLVYLCPVIILNIIQLSPLLFWFHLIFQSCHHHQSHLFFQGDTIFLSWKLKGVCQRKELNIFSTSRHLKWTGKSITVCDQWSPTYKLVTHSHGWGHSTTGVWPRNRASSYRSMD